MLMVHGITPKYFCSLLISYSITTSNFIPQTIPNRGDNAVWDGVHSKLEAIFMSAKIHKKAVIDEKQHIVRLIKWRDITGLP